MKARFDAGTDIAMVGAWDARRAAQPLSALELKQPSRTLETDAAAGHLFLIHTRGDGGGFVDVYVNETIPTGVTERLTAPSAEFLLALPSGSLVVDGAEYYRSSKPNANDSAPPVTIPAGDYAVRWYAAKDDEATPASERELEQAIGSADLAYYDRTNRLGCSAGAATLLLFPALWFPVGWKVALIITIVVFVAFFHIRKWVLARNPRYSRLDQIVTAARLGQQDPTFVLELRPIADRAGLAGGAVSV